MHPNTMPFIIFKNYLHMCTYTHAHDGVCSLVLVQVEAHSLMEGVFLDLAHYFLRQGLSLGPHWPTTPAERASSWLLLSLSLSTWVPGMCLAFTQS